MKSVLLLSHRMALASRALGPLLVMAIIQVALVPALCSQSVHAVDALTPVEGDAFSFVVIPDTQSYSGSGTKSQPDSTEEVTNRIFAAHTKWVVDHLKSQNIVFVSHVGDIVDKNSPEQWETAQQCIDVLHGKVPYGISVGNHDMTSGGDATLFQKYFPASRFDDFPWYGGTYAGSTDDGRISGNNANSYQLLSASGIDLLFMHLECNAPDDVLDWANETLSKHSDRVAFITSHMGWGPRVRPKDNDGYIKGEKGRMEWIKIHGSRGNSPQQMWEKCYRRHENLVAVFSGDQSRTVAYQAATKGDHGNVIREFLQDYGSGFLRLYRFTPKDGKMSVEVFTVHSSTGALCEGTTLVPEPAEHCFRFEFPVLQTAALK